VGVGAAIAAVAMALPDRRISNQQLAARLGVDADWITKRTGTRERPWASGDERLSALAAEAGPSRARPGRRRAA
jgi:3-oxoacyl-[acyl-carrier-protein] synthase III